MKKLIVLVFFNALLFTGVTHAQDGMKNDVKNNVTNNNENADNLNGKKIQQQSLSSGKFEKLDTITPIKTVKKKKHKSKLKH